MSRTKIPAARGGITIIAAIELGKLRHLRDDIWNTLSPAAQRQLEATGHDRAGKHRRRNVLDREQQLELRLEIDLLPQRGNYHARG